jgi:hypothetical protein
MSAPVSYLIEARVDEESGTVSGRASVVYRNRTDDTLTAVWLHCFPEALRDGRTDHARELVASGRYELALSSPKERGGLVVDSVETDGRVLLSARSGTEYELVLATPLYPGDSLDFELGFRCQVPTLAAEFTRKGRAFLLSHWFPQVAAYVEPEGWQVEGYHLIGHSPAELAYYDVSLSVPADMAVAAPGAPAETQWCRWPPGTRSGMRHSTRTVRLRASEARDFALVLNPNLIMLRDSTSGTVIQVFASYPARFDWLNAIAHAKEIITAYTDWYGPCPVPAISVVQADGLAPADASYPGLIVMARQPIPSTRLFEQALARQIARQWFSHLPGVNELRNPWVGWGPAVYSEIRYMEEKYGQTNLLDHPLLGWLLRGAGAEYYHQTMFYVAASNGILGSNLDPSGYEAETRSKPALLLLDSERERGRPVFDSLIREYLRSAQRASAVEVTRFAEYFPDVAGRMQPQDSFALDNWGRLGSDGVMFKPIVALPRTNGYQIFAGPYAWYDTYHGFQLCAWMQGRQFYDAGPLHGRHQWTASEIYSSNLSDWHSSVNYQTPLTFISDRLRVYAALDYSLVDAGAKLFFSQEFGPAFRQPKTTLDFGYRVLDMYNLRARDTLAWQKARSADLRLRLARTYESRLFTGGVQAYARRGLRPLLSNYDYLRAGLEQSHTFRGLRPLNLTLRVFAGYVWGDVPKQDQFFLSGGLSSNSAEPVSWGYQGWTSGQEHWHYDADVNCRGYAGEYRHGRAAYGLNLYFEPVKFIQPFFDLGNVGDNLAEPGFLKPRLDAGIRLALGPLYADFPFWRYSVAEGRHEFAFRWMLGLKMGGLLGSS